VRRSAHSLKGAAGYLATDTLCATAHELERAGLDPALDVEGTWRTLSIESQQVLRALEREAAPGNLSGDAEAGTVR
jgi:HPt (histidine-containing phosphotransfer) domain-containing protein